jgi:hypothetical protein
MGSSSDPISHLSGFRTTRRRNLSFILTGSARKTFTIRSGPAAAEAGLPGRGGRSWPSGKVPATSATRKQKGATKPPRLSETHAGLGGITPRAD